MLGEAQVVARSGSVCDFAISENRRGEKVKNEDYSCREVCVSVGSNDLHKLRYLGLVYIRICAFSCLPVMLFLRLLVNLFMKKEKVIKKLTFVSLIKVQIFYKLFALNCNILHKRFSLDLNVQCNFEIEAKKENADNTVVDWFLNCSFKISFLQVNGSNRDQWFISHTG